MTAEQASAALHELMHGSTAWQYAFAMGHGCSIGPQDEVSRAIRDHDARLRQILAEHRETA